MQLRIDAMFAGRSSQNAMPRAGEPSGAGPLEGAKCSGGGAAGGADLLANAATKDDGPSCYVCRGGLGSEGGDVLCTFCERGACERCWQNCLACEMPLCSLCLAADFSSEFECYFCPPCLDRKRDRM